MRWIPEIARHAPAAALEACYAVLDVALPPDTDRRVETALAASHLTAQQIGAMAWRVELSGRTRVYGVIAREVDEHLTVTVSPTPEGGEITVLCLPQHTHEAHAAGAAGVLLLAVTAWLTRGWWAGLPLGAATLLAGWMWADAARTIELQHMERRIRGLAFDLGRAVWPEAPGQLTPVRRPSPLLGR